MEARELRIGNWARYVKGVAFHGGDETEIGYRDLENSEIFEPIPLTEEWLAKFGFELETWKHKSRYTRKLEIVNGYVKDSIWCFLPDEDNKLRFFGRRILDGVTKNNIWEFSGREGHAIYVHRFQNLYYALTGEELVIQNK
tara:strand:- start:413 stop:835 length:423 start_codon:yes stop_codon:yes gene_type:complete